MSPNELNENISNIREYFEGKTIFLTGGTGFLGRLIIEKLLRTCSNVKKIYILVREKKGVDPHERIKETFNVPAFDLLKKKLPDFCDKLSICSGDCLLPNLGLSPKDLNVLQEEVNCVLHCAATVRFDASLKKAVYINVRAVRDILQISKGMKHLSCFLHVSTAYSYCPRRDIDEVFYEPPMRGEKLIALVDMLNDDMLDAITPAIIGEWPNTYAFTKAVAEDLIKNEVPNLPISIVRPSMITATVQEPIRGWVDNIYGLTGVMLVTGTGLLKTIQCDKEKVADIIPVDYVVNVILAAAWETSQKKPVECNSLTAKEAPIYNCISGSQNPLKWGQIVNYAIKHALVIPSSISVWYYSVTVLKNRYLFFLAELFFHTLPAYSIDFILWFLYKKPIMVNSLNRLKKFASLNLYFALQEWHFKSDHVHKLWKTMNMKDKALFNFDISKLNWDDYCRGYVEGVRVFLIKDPMETVPQARRKLFILKIIHYTFVFLIFYCVYSALKQLVMFYLNILG